jgi:hypothetical protein
MRDVDCAINQDSRCLVELVEKPTRYWLTRGELPSCRWASKDG